MFRNSRKLLTIVRQAHIRHSQVFNRPAFMSAADAAPHVSSPAAGAAPVVASTPARPDAEVQLHRPSRNNRKRRKRREKPIKEGSSEEILLKDLENLLLEYPYENTDPLPEPFTEIELEITSLSSVGDGLAVSEQGRIYVVPFSVPGDKVVAKVIRHNAEPPYSQTDFIKVVQPSADRDDGRIRCRYFASCSGCQFQQLSYEKQLSLKRDIVVKAFANFSNLNPELLPIVEETVGSPLQYAYRTKLTPHFDGPRNARRGGKFETVPEIGFMKKGTRKTIDIEECPIGTPAVEEGMRRERKRVAEEIATYKKGATLLLRESTRREADGDVKFCITDSLQSSVEYIGSLRFNNPAGSFFQNNSSILPLVASYIRAYMGLPHSPSLMQTPDERVAALKTDYPSPKHLIDAYCGSGLFSVTLSAAPTTLVSSHGIDIDPSSISYAKRNAENNKLPEDATFFHAADAASIFAVLPKDLNPDETAVLIDPPRKGCDQPFLNQLLELSPQTVVYVSCNVHTQARDVGILVSAEKGGYDIERIQGFDFFPQTGHVESVCVLRRRKSP